MVLIRRSVLGSWRGSSRDHAILMVNSCAEYTRDSIYEEQREVKLKKEKEKHVNSWRCVGGLTRWGNLCCCLRITILYNLIRYLHRRINIHKDTLLMLYTITSPPSQHPLLSPWQQEAT